MIREKECRFQVINPSCEGRDVTAKQLVLAFKAGVVCYVLYLVIFGTINYIVGQGIGGPELAGKYAGYFLANGAILVTFVIPGVGTLVALFYGNISSQFEALFGITSNYWIGTWVNAMTLVIGIIAQTVSVTYVVLKLYYLNVDRKSLLSDIHSR